MNSSRINESKWLERFTPDKHLLKEKTYLRVKRLLDLLIVLVSAPFWFPIVIPIAIAIKISAPKDPVFFVQQRTGKDGKRFAMYKFRTMVVHSDIDKKTIGANECFKMAGF